ncbi:MAG: putative zinc protease [Fimbriimonadaceae bacterium]|nr:putative zinc protease [Fimbriimonadaceae bacterium]
MTKSGGPAIAWGPSPCAESDACPILSTSMSEFTKAVLPNGVRVLIEPVPYVQSVAIGLWCATGSRHEFDDEAGITHLIEHMLFKGTEKRTAKEIAQDIEGLGGHLNAFTDKESTCYYCRMLAADAQVGLDVLTDMLLHSRIDPEELAREQGVVLEEIKRNEDEPSDHVHELHLQARWGQHPLGKPVIGTRESVSGFAREHLLRYMERQYRGANVLVSIAGNVEGAKAQEFVEQLLGGVPSGGEAVACERPYGSAVNTYVGRDVEQVHFCIGTDGASVHDDDVYVLSVLDSALGGSMSSRLFQEIREKRGLAYAIGSYSLAYSAGGAYTVYGGTSPEQWPLVQELVAEEFARVSRSGLEDEELARTKRSFAGQLAISLEGMGARMMRNARNEIYFGRRVPVTETLAKIDAVTHERIVDLAERMFAEGKVSTTAIGPE